MWPADQRMRFNDCFLSGQAGAQCFVCRYLQLVLAELFIKETFVGGLLDFFAIYVISQMREIRYIIVFASKGAQLDIDLE